MKFHRPTRRLFLSGAGKAMLVLPSLPSLFPRAAQAQAAVAAATRPVRFIQVMNVFGPTEGLFFGGRTTNLRPEPNVNVKSLVDEPDALSPIFGAAFNPLKSKMSMLRGLDVQALNTNHHSCFASCASSYALGLDGDGNPPLAGQESMDVLLSKSAKVYAPGTPASRRLVNLNPVVGDDYSDNRSFSWQKSGGSLQQVPPVKQTQSLYDAFASGFGAVPAQADNREAALMQAVYGDYKQVRDGTRISAGDKLKLDGYMSLINDISNGLKPTATGTALCADPGVGAEVDLEARIANQFRILAAAMLCDLTRVATITLGMSAGYLTRHDEHHHLPMFGQTVVSGLITDLQSTGARVAKLLSILDAAADGQSTLLQNSIVYWSMQYGLNQVASQHQSEDMPVMVAGGAGGALRQGNYIDYRVEKSSLPRRGLVLNNLLVTFMNCMGLSSADYETTANQGYGHYLENDFANRPNPSFWSSPAGRRAPLPYLYQGPTRD